MFVNLFATYVTGYWKTDRNVTFGLFHFIGPADSHTHTLPVHCCIDRPSWLACFSRAGFANYVKSRLEQWGPWKAPDGVWYSPPVLVTCLLGPPGLSGLMTSTCWTHGTSKQSCWKLYPVSDCPPTPPLFTRPPPYMCNPWYTVVVKKLLKIQQC